MDELPDRAVIDLEAALAELGNEPAQGEVPLPQRSTSQSRCAPAIFLGLWPPIWPGATLPVVATRFSQLIAVLSLTPNRAAA